MSSSAGFKRAGVACANCGVPFSLFLGVEQMKSVEKLSDPFQAKCPECGDEATYRKSSIETLVAVGSR